MRWFEYKFLHTARVSDITRELNMAGKERWEVVQALDVGRDYSFLLRRSHGSDEAEVHNEEIRINIATPDAESFKRSADQIGRLVPRIPPDPNTPWAPGEHDV